MSPADQGGGSDRESGFDEPFDRREMGLEPPGVDEIVVVPWPLLWRQRLEGRARQSDRYPWIVLSAALVGLFTVYFSITVLTIAIPRIADEFGTTDAVMTWVITGPLLLGAIVTPAAGKLADLFGARRVYLVSMVVVAIFAGLAAMSWSAGSLIGFRVIGAAVGAATGPASIAIINRLFPAERRAQALGYWALVGAGGPVIGVVVGGPIVELVSWRWIFVGQVPLSLATVLVCAAVFPDTGRGRHVRFDLVGALLLAAGTGLFIFALNRAPEPGWGWSHPAVIAGLVLAPAFLVGFALYEQRIPHQLLPMRYFRRGNVVFPMTNLFFTHFAYMGGFFLTPFLLQDVLAFSPSKTGYLSIARPLTFSIVGPLAGWLATRVGERINGVVGGAVLVVSMLLFSTVTIGGAELVLVLALMLSGVGMGFTLPAMSTAIANTVDERDLGVAGGAEQMLSQLGVVVGTQVMMTVQQASAFDDTASYAHGYLVGAAAAGLGVLTALLVRPTVGPAARTRAETAVESELAEAV